MADNVQITQGSGTTIATDDVAGVHYPRSKISQGADGSAIDTSGAAPLPVRLGTPTILTWTPTLDTAAYATGDSLYTTVTTITSAVSANGKVLLLDTLQVLEKTTPSGALNPSALDVLFFNATMTPSAANAASAISDADMALCIGFVTTGPWTTNTINSFSTRSGIALPLKAGAATTSIFAAVIVRGTPTYAASDLIFTIIGYELP